VDIKEIIKDIEVRFLRYRQGNARAFRRSWLHVSCAVVWCRRRHARLSYLANGLWLWRLTSRSTRTPRRRRLRAVRSAPV